MSPKVRCKLAQWGEVVNQDAAQRDWSIRFAAFCELTVVAGRMSDLLSKLSDLKVAVSYPYT